MNIRLCQEFHWTLEYAASLNPFRKAEIFGVMDGQAKAEKHKRRKK